MQNKSALMANSLEDAVQLAQARTMQSGLMQRLGLMGVGLAGLGAGARGVQSLYGLYRRNVKKPKKSIPAPVKLQVPYPSAAEPEEKMAEEQGPSALTRAGNTIIGTGTGLLGGSLLGAGITGGISALARRRMPINWATRMRRFVNLAQRSKNENVMNIMDLPTASRRAGLKSLLREGQGMRTNAITNDMREGSGVGGLIGAAVGGVTGFNKESGVMGPGSFMRGDQATSETGIPWMMPASMLMGVGGLYGGWKAADKLLDARRKSELKGELDKAKTEYEQALLSEYPQQKISSDVNAEFDRLYAEFEKAEKRAGVLDKITDPLTWTDTGGKLTGAYLTAAGLGSAATAAAVYSAVKKRQESQLLRKAQKNRERKLFETQPSPLYAEAVPMPR